MKSSPGQKSILSFFSKTNKENVKKDDSDKLEKKASTEDSPIKQPKRKSRIIESDSEEEEITRRQDEKENQKSTPEKKRSRNSSPVSRSPRPSSSKCDVGFSSDTVPPLRKTARKNMSRKENGTEDQQRKLIEKLKSDSSDKIGTKSDNDDIPKATKENGNSTVPDSNKKPKRTNCLDEFIFSKTPKTNEKSQKKVADSEPTDSNPTDSKSNDDEAGKSSDNNAIKTSGISPTKSGENNPNKKSVKSTSNESSKSTSPARKSSETSPSKNKKTSAKEDEDDDDAPKKSAKRSASSSPKTSPQKHKSDDVADTKESKQSPSKDKKSDDSKPSPRNPFAFAKNKSGDDATSTFDPSQSNFNPLKHASWKQGESVPFAALAKTFEIIEETSGRLKTIEVLSNFFRSVIVQTPEDFLFCVYLCLNKVAPAFDGVELGVGDLYVCKAIAEATGRSVAAIKSDIGEKGDLGIVAEQSKSNQRVMFQPARLTVRKVFSNLKDIALMSGHASQSKKVDKIKAMLVACKGSEARFLVRFLGGKLRIGLAEQSVLQAVAQASYLTPPGQQYPPKVTNAGKGQSAENLKSEIEEFALIFKTTYCECPSFDIIIPVLLEHGMAELPKRCKLQPGIPLKPMLAHPTKGVSEVLKRFEKCKFTCEYKYDGERAQIHLKEDGTVSIFSRNQENNTSKYPDIVSRFKESLGPDVKSCILDSEAVAYNVQEHKILPFQVLSTRKRKDADEKEIKVQVCVFPFDLLYLNGRNLVTETFEVRRDLLKQNFVEKEAEFLFAKSMDSNNTEDIEEFLDESIKGNCEGLMVKSLDVDATYEIAKRSRNWLKLKKDYLDGVGDTIDVVVIGGYLGKGKRTGSYGGFLLACYDPENEEFQSLCKIGTGFSDESLQKHTEFFKNHVLETPKSYYRYENSVAPDHWFDAVQVWEIKCADLSVSPVHKAAIGIVDSEKGISLRFPRFLRIRDDKGPEEATSASQIADLYRSQDQIKNQSESQSSQDEEFY